MELIRPFSKLNKNDAPIAGGKGASLGEMTQAGIPVPPGFVILADTFERFLKETDLNVEIAAELDKVDHREMHTIENASETIQALVLNVQMPQVIQTEIQKSFKDLNTQFVAVRSSATAEDGAEAAWAGQLDTFLNTTEESLLQNVQRCWASLFTPRAIFYRFEKGFDTQKISVAVVVQKMVNSDKAGIAFSVHPVTENRNQMIIESGWGLGEAVVSGQVTPDSYVVTKEPLQIIDINIGEQAQGLYRKQGGGNEWIEISEEKAKTQVLTKEQILNLADILIRIESHYNFPVDTEWAMEGDELYVVQSRPITTLSGEPQKNKTVFEKVFARDFCMVALEIAALSEKREDKEWMIEPNPYKPYMLIERTDGTCSIWYNKKGIEWTNTTLLQRVKRDTNFLKTIEKEVREGIAFIRPLYEKQKAIGRQDLLRFINEFLRSYSWIEAMWWIKSMESVDVGSGYENIVKLREETETLSAGTEIVIRKSLEVLYPELGILSSMIQLEELRNNSIPPREELLKRLEGFTLIDGELGLKSLDTVAIEKELILERESVDFESVEIKGEIGYRGKIRGKVCRLMGHADFGKIKEGEILVSPMTMVDFLPEMKKAAAFITDEGGVTCHAAIVARELKKPCVIGTKFATQILKDGMEVEVDADKGIVRIIKNQTSFEKIYTRDTTILMQEAWGIACSDGVEKFFGKNPYNPGIIHFIHEGSIEIWENRKATQWLMDIILAKNNAEPKFTRDIAKTYLSQLAEIRSYWGKKYLQDIDELPIYFNKVLEAVTNFVVYYYSAVDERTPKELREEMLKIRDEDTFFATSDAFIRATLLHHYPAVEGYETVILIKEVKSVPSMDELKLRRQHMALIDGRERETESLEDLHTRHPEYVFQKEIVENANESEIKGQIAQPGLVQGRVRILRRRDQIKEVMEGEIIVSPMTTPDFLPAMEKAAAFVTDEGGITCHAGIVARELKKPCIIGTKFATQLLKDGDLVEVDANTGIVKKL